MINSFNQRLIELRREKNLNQRELAKAIKVSQVAVCKWEQGINLPSIDILYRLCVFFGVSADYLIGLEDDDGSKSAEYGFEYQRNDTTLKHREKNYSE